MRTMPSEVFPVNLVERIYLLLFMFVAFSVFAICISKITAMFNKLEAKQVAYQVRIRARVRTSPKGPTGIPFFLVLRGRRLQPNRRRLEANGRQQQFQFHFSWGPGGPPNHARWRFWLGTSLPLIHA